MEKFNGNVISIRVFEPKEGMQVLYKTFVGVVKHIDEKHNHVMVRYERLDLERYLPIEELKTLVVDYEDNGWRKQLPLKYSQWQAAVDKGEVDSDKTVTVEIGGGLNQYPYNERGVTYAKIIPKKKRLYTEEELRVAMKYASSHLSSMNGINRYIDQLNKSKDSLNKLIANMDDESNFIGEG